MCYLKSERCLHLTLFGTSGNCRLRRKFSLFPPPFLLTKLSRVKGQIFEKTSCSQSKGTDDALFSYRFIPFLPKRRNPASTPATVPSLHEILKKLLFSMNHRVKLLP